MLHVLAMWLQEGIHVGHSQWWGLPSAVCPALGWAEPRGTEDGDPGLAAGNRGFPGAGAGGICGWRPGAWRREEAVLHCASQGCRQSVKGTGGLRRHAWVRIPALHLGFHRLQNRATRPQCGSRGLHVRDSSPASASARLCCSNIGAGLTHGPAPTHPGCAAHPESQAPPGGCPCRSSPRGACGLLPRSKGPGSISRRSSLGDSICPEVDTVLMTCRAPGLLQG